MQFLERRPLSGALFVLRSTIYQELCFQIDGPNRGTGNRGTRRSTGEGGETSERKDANAILCHAAAVAIQTAQLLSDGAAKVANHKQVPATTAPAKAEDTSPGKVTVPSFVYS